MANIDLEAAEPPAREPFSLDFGFRIPLAPGAVRTIPGIVQVLGVGLILRLVLALLPGFDIDLGTFRAWSERLADKGPWHFYSPDIFSDYAPGYLYVLWFFGEINKVFHFSHGQFEYLLKLPSIIADVGSAYVLYRFLEGQRMETRLVAASAYLLFPAVLLIGPIWGQVDSISALFVMLSIYYISRKRQVAGTAAYVVGFIFKPQIIAALPFLTFWIIKENPPRWVKHSPAGWEWLAAWLLLAGGAVTGIGLYAVSPDGAGPIALVCLAPAVAGAAWVAYLAYNQRTDPENDPGRRFVEVIPLPPRIWAYCAGAGFGVMLLLIFPFFPDYPWNFIDQLKSSADVESYRVNSFWAYNFWGMWGFFRADSTHYLGIAYRWWGIGLFGVSTIAIMYTLRRSNQDWALALGTALCLLASYVFLTRIHERYLFPFFLPFLAACVLARNPVMWATLAVLAVVHFLNLYLVYMYYQP